MTDAIFISTVVVVGLGLLFVSYCKFLKHKIKDSHSWNHEFIDDRKEGKSAMLMLLRQMKELEDKGR